MKVVVEGPIGRGIIWKGKMISIPHVGDSVCLGSDSEVFEVRRVIYDLADQDVLLRVR